MIKKLKIITVAVVAVLGLTLVATQSAFASDCNGQNTYFEWDCDSGDGITSLAKTIFNIVSSLVAAACLGAIVYGTIRYSTASSNANSAKEGLDIIRNSVIALVLYGFFYAIMSVLVVGGAAI